MTRAHARETETFSREYPHFVAARTNRGMITQSAPGPQRPMAPSAWETPPLWGELEPFIDRLMGEFGHCLTEVDERLSPGVEVAYGEAFGFKEDGLDAKPRRQPANAL